MYTWLWMTDPTSDAKRAIEQFQKYMRSRNPDDAPFLFNNPRPPLSEGGTEHPFESVLRFAYGYRDIITADNAHLNTMPADAGRWVLDLSAAGLWSHLNHWGRKGKLLSVRCNSSKPLHAIVSEFTGDDNDPGIRRARMKHNPESLGWKLLEPIAFVELARSPCNTARGRSRGNSGSSVHERSARFRCYRREYEPPRSPPFHSARHGSD